MAIQLYNIILAILYIFQRSRISFTALKKKAGVYSTVCVYDQSINQIETAQRI